MSTQENYYNILQIDKNATQEEIKKSYRKLSLQVHPDRNKAPDAKEKFQKLSEAYEVLSDPEKRTIYDQFGSEGLKERGHSFSGAEHMADIFRNIFASSPFSSSSFASSPFGQFFQRQEEHGKKILQKEARVAMKTLYTGKTFHITVGFDDECETCFGVGTKDAQEPPKCNICVGEGFVVHEKQINPLMMQHFRVPCQYCDAKGHIIIPEIACDTCNGKGTQRRKEVVDLIMEPGIRYGEKICMEKNNYILILVILPTKDKEKFKFDEQNNLYIDIEISLQEALFGIKNRCIEHLDERKIYFDTSKDDLIQNGDVFCLEGEGMPIRGMNKKGNLYITFSYILTNSDKESYIKNIKNINIEDHNKNVVLKKMNKK